LFYPLKKKVVAEFFLTDNRFYFGM